MSQFVFHNVELTVDMSDADFVDACTEAFEEATSAEKDLAKTGTAGDRIRALCGLFKNFADDVFGAGTAEQLFGDKDNLTDCREFFKRFLEACIEDTKNSADADKGIIDLIQPYTAEGRKQQEIKHRQRYAKVYTKQ